MSAVREENLSLKSETKFISLYNFSDPHHKQFMIHDAAFHSSMSTFYVDMSHQFPVSFGG